MASILVVDDDRDFSSAVATVLQAEGYDVFLEHVAENAMTQVEDREPDAVILDVMFPENPVAGFEAARQIRRARAELPILMLTAVNQQFPLGFSDRDTDPVWLPVTDFVEKPVDFRVLCEKIARMVQPQGTATDN